MRSGPSRRARKLVRSPRPARAHPLAGTVPLTLPGSLALACGRASLDAWPGPRLRSSTLTDRHPRHSLWRRRTGQLRIPLKELLVASGLELRPGVDGELPSSRDRVRRRKAVPVEPPAARTGVVEDVFAVVILSYKGQAGPQ